MKNIALIAIALLASAAFGEPSGPYMSYLGYEVGNGGTGEYSNYIGAYSGQYSTGISRCGFYGPASGQYGYNLYGCNGVGFYALADSEYMTNVFAVGTSAGRGASNCEDCIFIGKDSGRNASGLKGRIDIGGRLLVDGKNNMIWFCDYNGEPFKDSPFSISNGVTRIANMEIGMRSIGSFENLEDERGYSFNDQVHSLIEGHITNGSIAPYSITFCTAYCQGDETDFTFGMRGGVEKNIGEVIEDHVNKPRTSFTIEDEDTGEHYIIKVKSGALKLYKVEETEE